jgi:hypothetical protein
MKDDLRPYELERVPAREFLDGLCMTCDHADSCAHLARTEGPIWCCEEFDDSGPAAGAAAEPRPRRPMVEPDRRLPDGEPLGLCRNCENRSSCALPGAREGVWFCEEYR